MIPVATTSAPKTALVLAGGGSLGAVQVGMLRALVESDVKADMVVGSSVGAINGAYFAGDPTIEGVSKLERLWCGLKRSDIFPWTWRRLIGFMRGRGHLVTSDGLRSILDRHLPYRDMAEAAVPLHIVASDAITGNAVVLSRGPITQAILASTAIPAAFEPVEIEGRMLCDGAIASNTPVTTAIALGARRLIVLPTGFACAPDRAPSGAIASALHAITLLTASQLIAELERIREPTEYHILPTACPLGVTPFDFARTPELIDQAYRKTLDWIADGGLDKRAIPDALRPHWHTSAGAPRPPIEWLDRQGRESSGRKSFVSAAPDGRATAVN
jgi:NTE family protein